MDRAGGTVDERFPAPPTSRHEYELDGHGAVRAVAVGDGEAAVALDAHGDAVLPAAAVGPAEPHPFAGLEPESLDPHRQPETRDCSRRMPLSQRS